MQVGRRARGQQAGGTGRGGLAVVAAQVDEYVELAKAFFDDAEARFVNAALDGVARDVRGQAG